LLPSSEAVQEVFQDTESPDALSTIQKKYALIRLAGSVYVADHQALVSGNNNGVAQKFQPLKRSEAVLLINRDLANEFPEVNPKEIVKQFFDSPQTTYYEGIEFNPAGSSLRLLNLWKPYTVCPAKGRSQLIRDFLKDVICNGDSGHYNYLMKYLAHALQKPWEKPGVMVILLGGQGIGKGTFARILMKIWSATYLHVNQIKSITGEFNANLERSYIVWLDEAFFGNNRGATDSLKSLVTEPVIHINEKHQPARQVNSFHRFFGASNSDFYKATDRDDRRDFVLRVSETRKDNHDYWIALKNEIENGGVEALVHLLLKADLSSFNVRKKPHTKELMRQKLKSLSPVQQWWFDCLSHGEIIIGAGWPSFISTDSAIKGVCNMPSSRASHKPTAIEFAKLLKEFCPSSSKKQATQPDGTRSRGFVLPTLKQARVDFANYMGGEMKW
jgi:hypothetical protein